MTGTLTQPGGMLGGPEQIPVKALLVEVKSDLFRAALFNLVSGEIDQDHVWEVPYGNLPDVDSLGPDGIVRYIMREGAPYLLGMEGHLRPRLVALAVAGPVYPDYFGKMHFKFINRSWSFEQQEFATRLEINPVPEVRITNGTETTALGVVATAMRRVPITDRQRRANEDAPKVVCVFGAGAGSALVKIVHDGQWSAHSGASGHLPLTAPPERLRDDIGALVEVMHRRHDGYATVEDALSYRGVVGTYLASCELHGDTPVLSSDATSGEEQLRAENVIRLARDGEPTTRRALDELGVLAGFATVQMAVSQSTFWGGLFIGGSLAELLGLEFFQGEPFLSGFGHGGRAYRGAVSVDVNDLPVELLLGSKKHLALVGLAYRMLRRSPVVPW